MNISEIAAKDSQKSFMTLHEDPQKLHICTLPDHNYFIPFAKGQDAFALREGSDRLELLNGEWDFGYYESIIDMPDDFIECVKEKISVPSNWQLHGLDKPQYTNVNYPIIARESRLPLYLISLGMHDCQPPVRRGTEFGFPQIFFCTKG